jgi:hypothetical protein
VFYGSRKVRGNPLDDGVIGVRGLRDGQPADGAFQLLDAIVQPPRKRGHASALLGRRTVKADDIPLNHLPNLREADDCCAIQPQANV